MSQISPLNQADGYGLLLGLGVVFALGMITTTVCLSRYHGEATDSSECFGCRLFMDLGGHPFTFEFGCVFIWNFGRFLVCEWSDGSNSSVLCHGH
jgi:hypothetical protein